MSEIYMKSFYVMIFQTSKAISVLVFQLSELQNENQEKDARISALEAKLGFTLSKISKDSTNKYSSAKNSSPVSQSSSLNSNSSNNSDRPISRNNSDSKLPIAENQNSSATCVVM